MDKSSNSNNLFLSSERMVERIFMQVSVTKREAEIKLDNKDFDERATNYRRKKWIQDGHDPDEMEQKLAKEKADRIKEWKANAKQKREALKNSDKEKVEKYGKDDRFKGVQLKTIAKKEKIKKLNNPIKKQKNPIKK